MDYLINLVKEKAALNDEQARAAVEAVVGHFKQKFPGILHSEIDKVAAGADFGDSAREKFDQLREKIEEAAKSAGVKAEGFAEEMKNKFSDIFGSNKPGNK